MQRSVKIKALRPTQVTVGLLEVADKSREMTFLPLRKRRQQLEEKPAEIIFGPDREPYLVNHHHVALAAHFRGFLSIPSKVISDYSSFSKPVFWSRMRKERRVHLCDERGDPCNVTDLPRHLWRMRDNVYRSLDGLAKEKGAFRETPVPFAEFYWADFYRRYLTVGPAKEDFERALLNTMALSHSSKARQLPGYTKVIF